MRKLIILLPLLTIALLLSNCNNTLEKHYRIGILLFGDSRQPQVDGVIDGLKELGYEQGKNTDFFILNTKNNRKSLPAFVSELSHKNLNLMIASGGLEADAMRMADFPNKVPVVVSYVNAIKERKLVIDRRDPGWAVTGVDNLNAELSGKRVELIHDLLPDAKRILILYYQKIAPSRIGVEYARKAAEKLGLEIDARAVNSQDEIKQVMSELKPGDVDAMLTVPTAPIDNALKLHIIPIVNQLKLPLMTHSRPLTEAGALASYGAHFYDLGIQASRLADKILRGVDAKKLPFETPNKYTYTMNRKVINALSLQLPDAVKNQINDYINE